MPRMARFKKEGSCFHVHAKAAGYAGEYFLADPLCQRRLIETIEHYANAYCCQVYAFCVMGNHWHAVIKFDEPEELSNDELTARAKKMYPNSYKLLQDWGEEKWQHFNKRLFDLSEFMRNVQASFARWYNKTFDRQGRFWSGRFKSTVLGTEESLLDCMLYVDLNPVRAGIAQKPEEFKAGSAYLREIGKAEWLAPLHQILGRRSERDAVRDYKEHLYYRGSVATKEKQAVISERVLKLEEERGFKASGVYRKRIRYFTDGVIIGGKELIRQELTAMREMGRYLRRKNPIPQEGGLCFSLREQRGHAVYLE